MLLTKYFLKAILFIMFLCGVLILQAHYTYAVSCSEGCYYNNNAASLKKCPVDPVYGPSPSWLGLPDGDKDGACTTECDRNQLSIGACLGSYERCANCVYYDDEGNSIIKGKICVQHKRVLDSKPGYECKPGPVDLIQDRTACICVREEEGSCTPVTPSECPSCKSLGESCSTATECCDGSFCEGAKCRTCNVDWCSYTGTSQATSASCRVGNNVCSDLLSAKGIPESACASGTCDCCGSCLDDGASGCVSAGDCCNHNCVGGVCQCAPSCPDPSTYCANQHPSNGCGGSCSTPGTKQPSCPAPSTYCPGQEPDNGCGQKCPAGTKTPNCSCAANTCTGSTCSNGCGGTCAGTKDCTNYLTCSLRNLSCPTSANVGSNFNVSYEYFNTGPSSPYEVRMGLTNIQPAAGCTSGSGDVLWCQSSNTNGQGSWSSESRTVKCPATAGNFKITAGCFADTGSFACPASTYSGGNINEKQECTVNCVAPATCAPDTSQACCTGATNLWDNTATNPNKATATGVWLLSSQFPESAPPNNQAQCCSDDASEVYISPTNARACDGTAACCNANDYVMNGQCYTAFSLSSPTNARSTAQTTTSIAWAWNAVSGATYYLARLNNNTPVNLGNVTTRLQSGLTPNTSYWLEVAACNLCGCSAYSPRVTVNTLSGNQPPGQPTLEPVP